MKPSETLNILPGMSASVFVELSTPNEAGEDIIIPITSLVSSPEKEFYVWLYDSETTGVVKRMVEIGQIKATGVQVLEGLNDGELIVGKKVPMLRASLNASSVDGDRPTPTEPSPRSKSSGRFRIE